MQSDFGKDYLSDVLVQFQKLKTLADRALAQISEQQIFLALDPQSNSVAVIMKHMAGNMLSRWTDFLDSDGEKPGRQRDREFEIEEGETKDVVLKRWESGWRRLFEAVAALTPEDLGSSVLIRGEPHSVIEAIQRQLSHQAYHVGQLVLLAKHLRGAEWQSLSIPRGKSTEYNEMMRKRRQA